MDQPTDKKTDREGHRVACKRLKIDLLQENVRLPRILFFRFEDHSCLFCKNAYEEGNHENMISNSGLILYWGPKYWFPSVFLKLLDTQF